MTENGYSEESKRLAHEVAERASANLRRAGRTVERSAITGRYVISSAPPRGRRAARKSGDD